MKIRKDLRNILKKLNAIMGLEAQIVSLKNHVKIIIKYKGRKRYWITSSTPSDRNAIHATLRNLKSILNDLRVETMPEFSIGFTTIGMKTSTCRDKNITALWSFLETLESHAYIPQQNFVELPAIYLSMQARNLPENLPRD